MSIYLSKKRFKNLAESVDDLLFDISSYLIREYNLYAYDMIENYKKGGEKYGN